MVYLLVFSVVFSFFAFSFHGWPCSNLASWNQQDHFFQSLSHHLNQLKNLLSPTPNSNYPHFAHSNSTQHLASSVGNQKFINPIPNQFQFSDPNPNLTPTLTELSPTLNKCPKTLAQIQLNFSRFWIYPESNRTYPDYNGISPTSQNPSVPNPTNDRRWRHSTWSRLCFFGLFHFGQWLNISFAKNQLLERLLLYLIKRNNVLSIENRPEGWFAPNCCIRCHISDIKVFYSEWRDYQIRWIFMVSNFTLNLKIYCLMTTDCIYKVKRKF